MQIGSPEWWVLQQSCSYNAFFCTTISDLTSFSKVVIMWERLVQNHLDFWGGLDLGTGTTTTSCDLLEMWWMRPQKKPISHEPLHTALPLLPWANAHDRISRVTSQSACAWGRQSVRHGCQSLCSITRSLVGSYFFFIMRGNRRSKVSQPKVSPQKQQRGCRDRS